MAHPAFRIERLGERGTAQLADDFRSDPSTHEHTARRHHFERQISSFRAVDRDKNIQRLNTNVGRSLQR